MIPHWFIGAHRLLEASQDHDHERTGEVVGLPVQITREDGLTLFKSVWVPSNDQLVDLVLGGGVTVEVYGGQPIMRVSTVAKDKIGPST
jgi:hypothetical protein